MRSSLRRLAAASLRDHQQDGGVLQLVQAHWQRMALALGRPLSAAATPEYISEATSAAMGQPQQQQQQAPPPSAPPRRSGPTPRAQQARELNDTVLSFAERVFAADLDAEGTAEGQAPTPEAAPPEEAETLALAAAKAQRRADLMRRRRAKHPAIEWGILAANSAGLRGSQVVLGAGTGRLQLSTSVFQQTLSENRADL